MIARGRGTHAPSLLRLVEREIVDHALVKRGDLVLVACSGGPDSTALLHCLALLRSKLGFELAAHGVDHGLRREAASELDLAERLATSLSVPFTRTELEVEPGSNLQARARTSRYAALREVARTIGAASIATAHTADDRAETLLMRLVRGTGPRGVAVLPPRAGDLVRPMIHARRGDVSIHLGRHRLESAQDPSNRDPRFMRVRIRTEILPALEALNPRVVEALASVADAMIELETSDDLSGLGRRQREQIAAAGRRGRTSVSVRTRSGDVDVQVPRSKTSHMKKR